MADIVISCPHCGQELEAPPEYIGELVECPGCEKEFRVPGPGAAAAAEPVSQACPECGAVLKDGAVLCIACGFHLKLGKKISTNFG